MRLLNKQLFSFNKKYNFSFLFSKFLFSYKTPRCLANTEFSIMINSLNNIKNQDFNKEKLLEISFLESTKLSKTLDTVKELNTNISNNKTNVNDPIVVPKAEFLNKRYCLALKKRRKRKSKKQITLRWR